MPEQILIKKNEFETFPKEHKSPFGFIFIVTLTIFLSFGMYLKSIKIQRKTQLGETKITQIETQFVMPEKTKPQPPKPKPAITPKKEILDLTKAPVLGQKQDFNAPSENKNVSDKQQPNREIPRPVYGLRRVYSTGIGASGTASDAVIGKIGNTLDKEIDTIKAEKKDLSGPLVSISTVTSPPKIKREVKPELTKEIIEAKVSGIIKVILLIDVDGKVKEVKILNDLGYGTSDIVRKAFLQCEFEPAMRDGKPVAVWFPYSIRFEPLD